MLLTWPVRRDAPRIPFGDAVVRELPVLAALEHVVAAIARAEDSVDAAITAQFRVGGCIFATIHATSTSSLISGVNTSECTVLAAGFAGEAMTTRSFSHSGCLAVIWAIPPIVTANMHSGLG